MREMNKLSNIFTIKFFALFSVALILSACAKSGTVLLNVLAKTGDYTSVTNIDYGSHPDNKLDIYKPSIISTNDKNPVIVFFYGGCWGECASLKKSDYLFVAQSFATKGYTTVVADYRQYPDVNFESLMSDASNVMRWVSQNISKHGGDSKRLFLIGHSSGAHIASMLTLNPRYLESGIRNNVRGFIGLAGPYDFLPLDEDYQRKLFNPEKNYANSQPINFVSPQSPSLLILHGDKDSTVGKHNAVNLAKKAKTLGVDQQLILYAKHDHVSILTSLSRPLQGRSTVLKDILDFMQNR